MSYFVYIVECKDSSLYTGFTNNIQKRIQEHNQSKYGAKSLRGKLPVVLVYTEKFNTINDALKREKEIKGWRREKKIILIAGAKDYLQSACAEESRLKRDDEVGVVQ